MPPITLAIMRSATLLLLPALSAAAFAPGCRRAVPSRHASPSRASPHHPRIRCSALAADEHESAWVKGAPSQILESLESVLEAPRTREDAVWYQRSIGSRPLLSAGEEAELGAAVQSMNHLVSLRANLTESLGRPASMDEVAAEAGMGTRSLRQKLQEGRAARRELVESNMRLVFSLAAKYARRTGGALEDLAQDGTIGLLNAVGSFDPVRGNRFSTFAWYHVRTAIVRAALDARTPLRLTAYMHAELARVREATASFENANGRRPSEGELAIKLKVGVTRVRTLERIRRSAFYGASLDRPVGPAGRSQRKAPAAAASGSAARAPGAGQSSTYLDLVASPAAGPDEVLVARQGRTYVRRCIDRALTQASLTDRERQVVLRRYGLRRGEGGEEGSDEGTGIKAEFSMRQVGEDMGLSLQRIKQIESSALKKLRRNSEVSRELRFVYEEYCEASGARGEQWEI